MRKNNKSEENSLSNFFCALKSLGNKITEVIPWKCGTLLSVSETVHVHTLQWTQLPALLSCAFAAQMEILFSNSSHLELEWEVVGGIN